MLENNMTAPINRILVSSNDPRLLLSRELVLKQAGFAVISVGKKVPVDSIPQDPPVGLIILGHSLSPEEQDALIEETRKRWPRVKILRLVVGDDTIQEISRHEFVFSSLDPRKLINICHQLLLLSDK
jgi:DNA-binding response OmpR family regulator